MNTTTYLKDLLTQSARYTLTDAEKEQIAEQGIETFILKKLKSKKFRKWKLLPECEARVAHAVYTKVSQHKPLTVVYPQGGYKLWRLPSSPQVDWAEFFNIAYILSYIAPLAASYKPGVQLIYYMHTLLMEVHDNLTTEEIAEYVNSFQKLINEFSKYLPTNIKISILKDADLYSRKEYLEKLEAGKIQAKKDYDAFSPEQKEKYLKMSKLNIKWNGKEDWTKLTAIEKAAKYEQAALYELAAVYNLSKVTQQVKAPENILLFTVGTKDFIGIGSTRTSIAKYWVGFGILEKDRKGLYERILTPSQYEAVKNHPHSEVAIDFLPLKNLKSVKVYPERFQFRR